MKFDGYSRYVIYNDGRVLDTKRSTFTKQQINPDGYSKITLKSDTGKRKTFSVHRLVAALFVPNLLNHPEVNHIDGKKCNNVYTNLMWCTHAENIKHAWDSGLITNTQQRIDKIKKANIGRYGNLNPRSRKIRCIETMEVFESLQMAGRAYGICAQGIGKNALHKQSSAGKHKVTNKPLHWEYI